MKKLILLLCVCFSMAVVSCKEAGKETDAETEMHEDHAADQADMAMATEYQCPMDCEEGKTYDKEGTCPVCKMSLKKVEGEHDEDHDENHAEDHDSDEDHN